MKYIVVLLLTGTTMLTHAQELFPQQCIGKWQGTMRISSNGFVRDSVKVLFTVAPLTSETWTWRMEYFSPQQPAVKDYVLKLKDREKRIFSTDEGGGIELLNYQFGHKLHSVFEIPGVLLTASYELINSDTIVFEVTSGKKSDTTGKDIFNYSVASVQRVVLKKTK